MRSVDCNLIKYHNALDIMAERGDNNFMRYVYRGEEGEDIPHGAAHITVHEDCTFVRAEAFRRHRNIVEIICHENVEKIEREAFSYCTFLRRVIMPGVKIVEWGAFYSCPVLSDVECGELELVKEWAFRDCESLKSIDLPSARVVEDYAFGQCTALTDVKFSRKLERIEVMAFVHCTSLERITIPLKDGLFTADDIFVGCFNLNHVDLIEGAELHESIAALYLKEWRKDMRDKIDSINQILPNAPAGGGWDSDGNEDDGEKAQVIRTWIRSVIDKMNHYKAKHQRLLNEAATLLELSLWKANLDDTDGDRIVSERVRTTRGSVKRARRELCVTSGASIVIKNVLPFLQLKS